MAVMIILMVIRGVLTCDGGGMVGHLVGNVGPFHQIHIHIPRKTKQNKTKEKKRGKEGKDV